MVQVGPPFPRDFRQNLKEPCWLMVECCRLAVFGERLQGIRLTGLKLTILQTVRIFFPRPETLKLPLLILQMQTSSLRLTKSHRDYSAYPVKLLKTQPSTLPHW